MNIKPYLALAGVGALLLAGGCGSGSGGGSGTPPATDITASRPINDTGIVLCGDYAYDSGSGMHNSDVNCATAGASQAGSGTDGDGDPVPAGQDAVYGRDAQAAAGSLVKIGAGHAGFDFTKLDENGDELSQAATDWTCVRDNVTGLVWENKTNDGGLRDGNNTYTWYSTDASNNGGNVGAEDGGTCTGGIGCDTEKYTTDVNALSGGAGLCGRNNWRLPHKEELSGIVHRDRLTPTIDGDFFPHTQSNSYWTASPFYSTGNSVLALAWGVNFTVGYEDIFLKTAANAVRLVSGDVLHAGEPLALANCQSGVYASKVDAIYTEHGDGTVTDTETGLMWQQCSLGLSGSDCGSGTANTYTWQAALAAAQTANEGAGSLGYTDWRLPSVAELNSLAELACSEPAINSTVFPNTQSDEYWSASPYTDGSDEAWSVYFGVGNVIDGYKKNSLYVRLVRAGQ